MSMSMIVNVLTNHDVNCLCQNNNFCGSSPKLKVCACRYTGYHPNPKPIPCKTNYDVNIARVYFF